MQSSEARRKEVSDYGKTVLQTDQGGSYDDRRCADAVACTGAETYGRRIIYKELSYGKALYLMKGMKF